MSERNYDSAESDRAKRAGKSLSEWANPLEAYRRPVTTATKLRCLVAVILVIAAIYYFGAK